MLSLSKHEEVPPTPASPVLPPEGEDLRFADLPPLGEVAQSAEGGLVLKQRPTSVFSAKAGTQTRSLRPVNVTPSPNPLPQGREGLSVLALSLWERVG